MLLILLGCVVFCGGIGSLAFVPLPFVYWGVGDTDQAMLKIKEGMTRDEVRSLLGEPHEAHVFGDCWLYWEGWPSSGSLLHVHFGPDGRVDERYCSIP
jgi:hypothetical protein